MKIVPLGLAAAMACTASAAANAADLPVPAVEETVEYVQLTWAGFYLGAQIGTITDDNDFSVAAGPIVPAAAPGFGGLGGATGSVTGEIEGRDLFGGLHAGYNWQWGRVVAGLEADASSIGQVDDVLATFRGRLGFGSERILVYGTAGLAYASVEGGIDGIFVGGNGGNGGAGGAIPGVVGGDGGNGGAGFGTLVVSTADAESVGFVGGVGAEVLLSPTVGIGAQALYHSFDFDAGSVLDDDFLTVSGRLTVHLNNSVVAQLGGPAPSAGSPWSGFYLGGHIGTLHGTADDAIDEIELSNGQNGGAGFRGIDGGGGGGGALAFASLGGDAGLTGGGHIGYNWQAGSAVFGAEADVDASTEDSNDLFGSLRGRLGWATPGFMLYGTAGVAVTSDDSPRGVFAGNGGNGGNGGAVLLGPGGAGGAGGQAVELGGGDDDTKVGFVGGAGIEAALGGRATAGLEALYYGFEDDDEAVALPPGAAGRFFVGGEDGSDALVVRTRFSFALQPR